jgi:predicted ester cyclase
MTNEERVRAYWREVWSGGDPSFALGFYAPTFRQNDEDETAADFVAGARSWLAHFEGFSAEVVALWELGDVVATRVVYRGRHVGDFARVPAAGAAVECSGLDVFVFEDGRCVQHDHEADHYTMFLQLGAPPAPAA